MDEKTSQNVRTLLHAFAEIFPDAKNVLVARAPGRINLIGEYTDFNDGFVLPASVDKDMLLAFSPRADKKCILHSLNFDNVVEFEIGGAAPDKQDPWGNYPKGVVHEFTRLGVKVQGFQGVVLGNIPVGGGMSSSAALEAVTALCVKALAKAAYPPSRLVKLCQKAEHDFAGVKCGVMDPFSVFYGKANKAMLLDCRTLDVALVPVPEALSFIVLNTKVKRELSSSGYNMRRFQCEESVNILKRYYAYVRAIRDVSPKDFERVKEKLEPVHQKRVQHVVYENERTKSAATLLGKNDLSGFGQLLYESHESLKNNFEVSTEELDFVVEQAKKTEGVFGARLMGAGFGGCAIIAAQTEKASHVTASLEQNYERAFQLKPDVHLCRIVDGAGILNCQREWEEMLSERA